MGDDIIVGVCPQPFSVAEVVHRILLVMVIGKLVVMSQLVR